MSEKYFCQDRFNKRLADHLRSIVDDILLLEDVVENLAVNVTGHDGIPKLTKIQSLDRTHQRLNDLVLLFDHLSINEKADSDFISNLSLEETRSLIVDPSTGENPSSGTVDWF